MADLSAVLREISTVAKRVFERAVGKAAQKVSEKVVTKGKQREQL